jgi:hypothetical protein
MPGATRKRRTLVERKALHARIRGGESYGALMDEDPTLSERVLQRIKQQGEQLDAVDTVDSRGRTLKAKNLGKSGPRPSMPFHKELVDLCTALRERGECVTSLHMQEYIRRAHPEWLAEYVSDRVAKHRKERHADALSDICRSVLKKSDIVFRTATTSKIPPAELKSLQRDFEHRFWTKFHSYPPGSFHLHFIPSVA